MNIAIADINLYKQKDSWFAKSLFYNVLKVYFMLCFPAFLPFQEILGFVLVSLQ